ncbi:MAG: hypothetical protein V1494_02025 [Candidatus Diapherotrites archaeon]
MISLKRVVNWRIAGKDVHIPKLIGAFLLFAAIILVVKGGTDMYTSWDNVKAVNTCLSSFDKEPWENLQSYAFFDCQQMAGNLGFSVSVSQDSLTPRQMGSALLGPIAAFFFWLAVLIGVYLFYRTGELVVPLEESVQRIRKK